MSIIMVSTSKHSDESDIRGVKPCGGEMGKPKKKMVLESGGEARKEVKEESSENVGGGAEGSAAPAPAPAPAARKRGRPRKIVLQVVQEDAMKAEDMKSSSSYREEGATGLQEGAESKSKSKS
eukprot:c16141_g1_i1 orf=1-366(-)